MRKNPLSFALALALVAGSALSAQSLQTPPPGQPPPAPAPRKQPPTPGTPYKPDFEIPRPEGLGGQPKSDPSTPGVPAEGYVIGPQDNLSIIVSGETELTGKYLVDTDGTISMPYLSRVPLAGLSLADAQDKITSMLKAGLILRNPQVRIEVDQFKARSVLMTGEVRTPGKVTLAGTTMSLLEALALAGSATQNASNDVIVMHPPKPGEKPPEPITLNRKDLELGKAGRDVTLQDGDIVNIPVAKRFYISGYVRNPGSFVLDTGTTVSQAIILAGGLSDRGTDRRIRIGRVVNGKSDNISAELHDKVLPNDEIKIRSRLF